MRKYSSISHNAPYSWLQQLVQFTNELLQKLSQSAPRPPLQVLSRSHTTECDCHFHTRNEPHQGVKWNLEWSWGRCEILLWNSSNRLPDCWYLLIWSVLVGCLGALSPLFCLLSKCLIWTGLSVINPGYEQQILNQSSNVSVTPKKLIFNGCFWDWALGRVDSSYLENTGIISQKKCIFCASPYLKYLNDFDDLSISM